MNNINFDSMKKATTKAMLLAVGAIMSSVSCTDIADIDILDIGSQSDWKTELTSLNENYSNVLENSGITLSGFKKVDTNKLTIEKLLDENSRCYPIYTATLSKFELSTLPFIQQDTTTFHFDYNEQLSYLNNLLENKSCIDVVCLSWVDSLGTTINTYALFDKESGELLYDNILSNVVLELSETDKIPMMLSRAEGGGDTGQHGDNFEIVYFNTNIYGTIAHASISWTDFGHWSEQYIIIGSETKVLKTWVHDTSEHIINTWVNPKYSSQVSALGDFQDISTPYYGMYKYYLWVGPNSIHPGNFYESLEEPGDEVIFGSTSFEFANSFSQGFAKWVMVEHQPEIVPYHPIGQ